ncbi:MAG TPA: VOC family protein [Myxococcota bacterium]|jgi:catechol 2,3-dioxygenase-like lactoylglutathione lyase family enzyme
MKITRINHMAFNVAGHVAEAREFYTKLLGIPEVPIAFPGMPPTLGSDKALWIQNQRTQMHLIGFPKKGELREPTNTHVSWYVEDLDVALADIRTAGLEFRQLGEGLARIIWIADPAGNTVELQQDPEALRA